jgi:hypothetical protein
VAGWRETNRSGLVLLAARALDIYVEFGLGLTGVTTVCGWRAGRVPPAGPVVSVPVAAVVHPRRSRVGRARHRSATVRVAVPRWRPSATLVFRAASRWSASRLVLARSYSKRCVPFSGSWPAVDLDLPVAAAVPDHSARLVERWRVPELCQRLCQETSKQRKQDLGLLGRCAGWRRRAYTPTNHGIPSPSLWVTTRAWGRVS